MTLLAGFDLARRLEGCDALGGARFAEALKRLRPGSAAEALPVAGGYAVYAGVGSPLTVALGLGMNGPVSEADLDRIEAYYRGRGVTMLVDVCPLAHRSLLDMLGSRGYRIVEFSNLLVRPSEGGDPLLPEPRDVTVREVGQDEADHWARHVARGFFEPVEIPPVFHASFAAMARMQGARLFLAEVGGKPAGGGLLWVDRGLARLAGASTLATFRRRGVHLALVRARLAAAAGCDLAAMAASPVSASHRNAERLGFRVAYTRAKLALDHRGGSEMLLQY
ncbi:MAG TPA: hypothetical protein VJ144_10945 [Candidatus Polarisedimenticolia bacterium]|nr:hypothetical protein [Candidatus Polarisedimenticolia bacterium]